MTHGQVLALIVLLAGVFTLGLAGVLAKTDIGQAVADAIRQKGGTIKGAGARHELEALRAEVGQLRAELEHVRAEVLEAHERLELAERFLPKGHDARADGPPP